MKGKILQMNCSKNAKGKKSDVIFKRIMCSWLICFLIGCSVGFFTGMMVNHTPPLDEAVAISVSAEEPKTMLCESELEFRNLGEFKLTAYCACKQCCGKSDGITASGVKATEGVTVAADTSILPFGTKIFIDGHEYTVQDRGGAIKGNRIDVYFDTHQEALDFGVQYKEIYILEGSEKA